SRPEHIAALLEAGADGAIVASAALDVAERGGPDALEAFVRDLAGALRPRVA
ncbi:MAG: tryptophan synthase subunit alpha, partial [Solirubrobacterales bacterium]|nr:tryptophan synthase subunit alpha [Solirubrobacterales bacterium]